MSQNAIPEITEIPTAPTPKRSRHLANSMHIFCSICITLVSLLVLALIISALRKRGPTPTNAIRRIVSTHAGLVRGYAAKTHFQRQDYFVYRGIPYAQPPIGELRFQTPQPIPDNAWSSRIREADSDGPMCLQEIGPTDNRTIIGAEDCLTLNVYTPHLTRTSRIRSVIVYVHGGAFYRRHGAPNDLLGPDLLIEAQVVLVTFNYRLGVLGFLATEKLDETLGDGDAAVLTGNWGLLDQRLVLQWVRTNILAFGGNPHEVTFAGHSAGALSVQMHRQAHQSHHLFARTIEMSTAFDERAVYRRPRQDISSQLRQLVGLPASSADTDVVVALRRMPAETLVRAFPFVQFETSIMPRADRFSDINTYHFMDVLTGCTSNEAISQAAPSGGKFAKFQQDRRIDVPSLRFDEDYESSVYLNVRDRIFEMYFHAGVENATLAEFVRLQSDVYQTVPLDRKVRKLAKHCDHGRTYQYQFGMDTRLNGYRWLQNSNSTAARELEGAAHGDELCYLFHCAAVWPHIYDGLTMDSAEYGHMKRISEMFAKFSSGMEMDWAPVQRGGDVSGYMRIAANRWTEVFGIGGVIGESKRKFWDNVLREFGEGQP